MRRWALVVVVGIAACGGSDSAVDTAADAADGVVESGDGLSTFASDDGVVSVEVPPGAAPEGFAGTVSLSDPSALDVDISDVESVLLVYELGPDGTEFSEPVTVTFRIPRALGGFDPDLGLPISLIVIEDGAGGFEPLGSMTSFLDGDVLVVEGTTPHFSTAIAFVEDHEVELVIDPPGRENVIESLFQVSVKERNPDKDLVPVTINRIDFSIEGPLEVFSDDGKVATIECVRAGVGTIRARLFGTTFGYGAFIDAFTGGTAEFLAVLSVEIECTGSPEVDLGPRSSSNPANEVDAGGQSSPVAINGDDCFDDDGPVDCVPEVDVVALAWVEQGPDLLELTVTFAGPVTGGGDFFVDIGIWPRGSGSPMGPSVTISDGVASCDFGPDGPLPGESCEVNASGEIVFVGNVSGMTGRIDVTIGTILVTEDDTLIRDAAQILGVIERT